MKLSDYRETYYEFSGKASDISRHLAFAGIAIIWIFKTGNSTSLRIPNDLIFPLALFTFALTCDLLQYISATIIWGAFCRNEEKKLKNKSDNPDLDAPSWLNRFALTFFTLKLVVVIVGYGLLINFFIEIWVQ